MDSTLISTDSTWGWSQRLVGLALHKHWTYDETASLTQSDANKTLEKPAYTSTFALSLLYMDTKVIQLVFCLNSQKRVYVTARVSDHVKAVLH